MPRMLNRLFKLIFSPLSYPLKYYRILAVFFLCFNCKSAKAQNFSGPIAGALGGAGRGAISGAEAAFLNPAALAHFKDFHLGAYHRQADLGPGGGERTFAGLFLDHNPEAVIPSALSFVQTARTTPSAIIDETDWQLSFGNFVFGQTAVGVSGRYFSLKERGRAERSNFNGTIGLLHNPNENLGLGLVGYNLFASDLPQAQPSTGAGMNYIFKELLRVRFDLVYPNTHNPDKKGIVMTGFESVIEEDFFLRFGYRNDDVLKAHYFTAGLGWNGPKIAIDYAFEKNLRAAEQLAHSFDLRIYF